MKLNRASTSIVFGLLFLILMQLAGCGSGGSGGASSGNGGSTVLPGSAATVIPASGSGILSSVADGVSASKITVTVKDQNGTDVADGQVITFTTTAGTLSSATAATKNGEAFIYLTSPVIVGTATVTASIDGISNTVTVTFLPGAVSTIALTATPANLTADGSSTSTIRVYVTDANGNAVANGETISFLVTTANNGILSAPTAPTTNGAATVVYTAPASKGTGTETIRAQSTNGKTQTVNIILVDASVGTVTVTSGAAGIVADGLSSTIIRAAVKDTGGNNVADGQTVSFSTTAGTLSSATAPTTNGVATVTLTSPTLVGAATITATIGGVSGTTSVSFFPGPVSTIALTATPANLTANGTSKSTLVATVLDANGNPVNAETLTFSVQFGTLANLTVVTAGGVATNQYTAPGSVPAGGKDTITVKSTNGKTANIGITLIGPAVSNISLSANPQTLPADGVSQAIVSATLALVGGGTVPDGTPVNFSILGAGGGSINPSGTTAGGTAIATLTSGTVPETVTVHAEAGGRIAEINMEYTPGKVTVSIIPNSLLGTGQQTAAVTATVLNAAGAPVAGDTINFTLNNGSMGTLVPASAVTNASGQAQVTFKEAAKGGSVTVTATWNNAGVEVTGSKNIDIQPPPAFIEVAAGSPNPSSINVIGTGGQSTSQVVFDVKDSQGFAVADGYRVDFVIDSGPNGNEALQPAFALTSGGKVSTILRSGYKSGPVSIKATYFYATNVNTTTSQITVNAGPPVGEEFGIFAQYRNISGFWISNLEDLISVDVGDIYGNPVPDNTAVSFKTYNTGGLIQTADAKTQNGFASKILHSTNAPVPLQGFVSVTVEANNGGRTTHVTSLAIPAPPGNNYIYAGTDGGGVYKSTNFGASWTNISRSSTIQGQNWIDPYVSGLAVDPDNPNVIYAATGYLGEGHIFRSQDGGATWNNNDPEAWFGVFFGDGAVLTVLADGGSNYVWAGTEGGGVIFATDGVNFTNYDITPPVNSVTGLGVGTTVRDIVKQSGSGAGAELYAATPTGVFRSVDGGSTWAATTSFTGNNITTLAVHPTQDVIYAGTLDAGLWYSADNGATWTQDIGGLGKGLSATVPAANPNNKGNGVMGSVTVGKSTLDENWTVVGTAAAVNGGTFSVTGSVSGLQTNTVTVGAPYVSDNAEVAFTIADGSTDFVVGDTFTFRTTRDQGFYIKDLLVDGGNNRLYAVSYFWGAEEPHAVGNVYVHSLAASGLPDATDWTEANSGLPVFSGDDPTLLAQHVLAPNIAGNPTALYIGGEGISLSKASAGLTTGAPAWLSSQSGMTNLVMARMPILFSGEANMNVASYSEPGNAVVYIQDANGNPPIQGSTFTVTWYDGDDAPHVLFEYTYPDAYIQRGTFRDPADPSTDDPFVIAIPDIPAVAPNRIEFSFTPLCQDTVPGCSGGPQERVFYGT
ncbi:MAG: invasin domain 3-containing protein [Desulfobacterales bacterium]|nr:invasin domain 3-containing protein [Desulfobacterales bacterium]